MDRKELKAEFDPDAKEVADNLWSMLKECSEGRMEELINLLFGDEEMMEEFEKATGVNAKDYIKELRRKRSG